MRLVDRLESKQKAYAEGLSKLDLVALVVVVNHNGTEIDIDVFVDLRCQLGIQAVIYIQRMFEARKHQITEFQINVLRYILIKIGHKLDQRRFGTHTLANGHAVVFLIGRIDVQILVDNDGLPQCTGGEVDEEVGNRAVFDTDCFGHVSRREYTRHFSLDVAGIRVFITATKLRQEVDIGEKAPFLRQLAVIFGIEENTVDVFAALLALVANDTILALEIISPRVLPYLFSLNAFRKRPNAIEFTPPPVQLELKEPWFRLAPNSILCQAVSFAVFRRPEEIELERSTLFWETAGNVRSASKVRAIKDVR
jgi:hypothetical protein